MLAGGVLDTAPADRMVSLHLASLLATGLVGARAGIAMSQAQFLRILLSGVGGHGSMAGAAGNVVLAVSALSSALPGIAAELSYDDVSCACSAGVIRAGAAANVVPRHAILEGTLRTFLPEQYDTARDRLHDLCTQVAADFDVNIETDLPTPVPAVVNDPTAVAAWRTAAAAVLGGERVLDLPPMHHAPDFTIDEESLRIAMLTMAATALELATP